MNCLTCKILDKLSIILTKHPRYEPWNKLSGYQYYRNHGSGVDWAGQKNKDSLLVVFCTS